MKNNFIRNNLSGKVALITGANSGLGYETALALADQNAEVIMACRNIAKSETIRMKLVDLSGNKRINLLKLDLSDLDSVNSFSKVVSDSYSKIDILVNNAGVMIPPYTKTKQGFELQFGTNHLAHFLLTANLFPLIKNSDYARIVTISSVAAKKGKIQFDDINWERKYNDWAAYSMSKLANQMFALELHERIAKAGLEVKSIAAHPGISTTELFEDGKKKMNPILAFIGEKLVFRLMAQPASEGALPQILACTSPAAESGLYYGPDGYKERKGFPTIVDFTMETTKKEVREKLWKISEEMVNKKFVL